MNKSIAYLLVRKLALPLQVILVLITLASSFSHAIIIRHDTGFSQYQVSESAYPQIFYLEQQGSNKTCVATLIDRRWAITAAHCLEQTSLGLHMAAGDLFAVAVAGREYLIDAVVVHENYHPHSGVDVDLALLRFQQNIELPKPFAVYQGVDEAGLIAELLGWGYSGIGTQGRIGNDGKFRRAENIIESAAARLRFNFSDPRSEAALALEGMPGLGDSGGPALIREEGRYIVVGVAVGEVMDEDFTEETQGKYGSVAVYERLSLHIDWIKETLCSTSSC